MILTVTPNPALDSTWSVDAITPGASHRVPTGVHRAGGKGVNVTRVLHSQGVGSMIVATAGGATGARFIADLDASGLLHALIPVAAETRQSLAFHDRSADATAIFNEAGVAPDPTEWQRLVATVAGLVGQASVVVISGSMPGAGEPGMLARLIEPARLAGVPVVVDTSRDALLEAARAGATLLKPNGDELAAAVGTTDVVAGARRLIELGAGGVIVSLGADGMLAVVGGAQPIRARLGSILRGNATGAGDAAVAAIAASLSLGDPLEHLLRRAVAWSAAAVLMPLAGEISPEHPRLAAAVEITAEIDHDVTATADQTPR